MKPSFPASRLGATAIAAWFVLMLLVPVIAYVQGNRSINIDNRQFEPWPGSPAKHPLDSRYYARLGTYLSDHVPVRDEAIQAQAKVTSRANRVLNGVINGKHGWKFLVDEISSSCQPQYPAIEVAATIERLHEELGSKGIPSLFVLSPDKITIMGDQLPGDIADLSCARAGDQALRTSLTFGPGKEAVDLWTALRQARARTHDQLFWKDDSHLAAEGRTAIIQAMVDTIQPGLFDPKAIVPVTDVNTYGDLSRLQGTIKTERVAGHRIKRPDVKVTTTFSYQPQSVIEAIMSYRTSGPGKVIPGNTVIINDSQFGVESGRQLQVAPWFAQSTFIHWDLLDTPQAAAALAKADRVIVETVERYRYLIVSALPQALTAIPAR